MCVTISLAKLTKTILYAAELDIGQTTVHVLGYQNKAQDLSNGDAPTGNAMLLPFPAQPKSMTRANVLSTEDCPEILNDMVTSVEMYWEEGRTLCKGRSSRGPVEVFEEGIYTIILAQDARHIPDALDQVPEEKRPPLNVPLFDAYAVWYPEWPMALCCFNNRDAAQATPMLWWYEPRYIDQLWVPALDCHTGDVPDLDADVLVDHFVVFASEFGDGPRGAPVYYQDDLPPSVAPYLLRQVWGAAWHNVAMPNGDFVCAVKDVRNGLFSERVERANPPGAIPKKRWFR